jgi:prepilin-type N-terminal cleavage/methylation domain-containing protein
MLKSNRKMFGAGFTLIELLVVMVIIGILATVGLVAFASAQARSRDARRKSDLKQISTALELYYSDYGAYPVSSGGKIKGCPSAGAGAAACDWGGDSSEFTDNVTTYMRIVPGDPSKGYNYYYRTVAVNSVANQGFQLFARLENTQDQARIATLHSCGGTDTCNFAITSPNVTPTQEWP